MKENDFSVIINDTPFECHRTTVCYLSEVVDRFVRENSESNSYQININSFSKNDDIEFVSALLSHDENDKEVPTVPFGREIFFVQFCENLGISPSRRNSIRINVDDPILDKLIMIEEELTKNLSEESFGRFLDEFSTKKENESGDCCIFRDNFWLSKLILNCCIANPFKIEIYIKFIFELSKINKNRKKGNNSDISNDENDKNNRSNKNEQKNESKTDNENEMCFNNCVNNISGNVEEINDDIMEVFKIILRMEMKDILKNPKFSPYLDELCLVLRCLIDEKLIDSNSVEPFFFLKPLFIDFMNRDLLKYNTSFKAYIEPLTLLMEDEFANHKKRAKESQNSDPITKILRSDDIDSLIKIEFDSANDVNSAEKIIPMSTFERCTALNNGNCTYIKYSAFCASFGCFKLLFDRELGRRSGDVSSWVNEIIPFIISGGSVKILQYVLSSFQSNTNNNEDNINNNNEDNIMNESNDSNNNGVRAKLNFSGTLMYAIRYHRWEIAEFLIEEKGVEFKNCPYLLTECLHYSNIRTLKYLFAVGVCRDDDFFLECCFHHSLPLAIWASSFSTEFALIKSFDHNKPFEDLNALHVAALAENEKMFDFLFALIESKKLNDENAHIFVNSKTKEFYQKSTPLIIATQQNNVKFTQKLLSLGEIVDTEKRNSNSLTPFHIACQKGNLEIVKAFLKLEKRIDINAATYGVLNSFFFSFFLIDLHHYIMQYLSRIWTLLKFCWSNPKYLSIHQLEL